MSAIATILSSFADPAFLALVKGSSSRKGAAETRLRFYQDRQAQDLFGLLQARWTKPEDFRLFQINVVRKIANKRAMVYKAAPQRVFEGMEQNVGEALYAAMGANVALKKANRLTKLLKTTALQVGWNGTAPTLSIVTPNIMDVETVDPASPSRIIVTFPGTAPAGKPAETAVTYSDWTATTYRRRDWRGGSIALPDNPGNVNPYGVLPFVPLFDSAPDDQFFLPGGDDLIEAQRAINVALVNLWRAIELQSHGQAWASGISAQDALKVGPDRAVTLPSEGKFGFAAPETPIAEVLKAIDFLIRQTAIANDLPATIFEFSGSSESGVSKLIDRADMLEARQDDLDLWRGYEAKLFEVVKRVVNTHRPNTIPDKASIRIDFGEVAVPTADSERLESWQRRLDMGIWSPVDALMADNPDIRDREEALAILQERRDEAAALGLTFSSNQTSTP
jgi:hypothetical protein